MVIVQDHMYTAKAKCTFAQTTQTTLENDTIRHCTTFTDDVARRRSYDLNRQHYFRDLVHPVEASTANYAFALIRQVASS